MFPYLQHLGIPHKEPTSHRLDARPMLGQDGLWPAQPLPHPGSYLWAWSCATCLGLILAQWLLGVYYPNSVKVESHPCSRPSSLCQETKKLVPCMPSCLVVEFCNAAWPGRAQASLSQCPEAPQSARSHHPGLINAHGSQNSSCTHVPVLGIWVFLLTQMNREENWFGQSVMRMPLLVCGLWVLSKKETHFCTGVAKPHSPLPTRLPTPVMSLRHTDLKTPLPLGSDLEECLRNAP